MNQINLRSRFRVKKNNNQQYCMSFTHNDVKVHLGFKPANINFATYAAKLEVSPFESTY